MTDFEAAVALLESGTRDETTAFLAGLTPQQRKVLGPKFRRWLTHQPTVRITRDREALAVIATAGGARQARLFATHRWELTEEFEEDAVRILGERSPAWLPAFVDSILAENSFSNWHMARRIVRAGLVPTPDHPGYFRGTVFGVSDHDVPLIEQLDRDPGLIGDHLLTMLSTEGTGSLLAAHDANRERRNLAPFPAGTWRVALVELVEEGRLDRGSLIDTILAAPLRDWAAVDLGWYLGMHDALEPTIDEIADRQNTYTRLLTVEHGPSVKTAQRELLRLIPGRRLNPEPFLAASRATLGRTDKASVAAHLRLLEKLAKTYTDVSVVDTVRIATEHSRADVRDQAAKLLARLGANPTPSVAGARFVPVVPESRPQAAGIDAVTSADELAEVLLGLLEEVDPLEMERAVDGLLRLADERPSSADLLAARAAEDEYALTDPRITAQVLTRAWLTPRRWMRDGDWSITLAHWATIYDVRPALPETFVGAIGRRLTGVARAVRAGRHPSVALPTATDFSLDADELNRRLRDGGRSQPLLEMEVVTALLRVPADERARVVLPVSLRRSSAVARIQAGRSPCWAREVVSYQRMEWEPVRRYILFRDELGAEGDAAAGILARSAPRRTVGPEASYDKYETRFEQTMGLGAALLPHDHDVLAAHAHPYLHHDLSKDRACSVQVIDAIARARTVNGPPTSSALVLALAAKDARGRTAAQDALLDLARYGVLDGTELGRQAALLLGDDIVIGQRVGSGLADCARASDTAVLPVLDALQEIVTVLPGRRDAGSFLELAADLAERTSRTITLPPAFHGLAAGTSSSMVAKAARRLLRG